MTDELLLRDVVTDDLLIFFEQQLNQEANYMAAFTAKDPSNKEAFTAHWHRIFTCKLPYSGFLFHYLSLPRKRWID